MTTCTTGLSSSTRRGRGAPPLGRLVTQTGTRPTRPRPALANRDWSLPDQEQQEQQGQQEQRAAHRQPPTQPHSQPS